MLQNRNHDVYRRQKNGKVLSGDSFRDDPLFLQEVVDRPIPNAVTGLLVSSGLGKLLVVPREVFQHHQTVQLRA
jgi:hypothetical protein